MVPEASARSADNAFLSFAKSLSHARPAPTVTPQDAELNRWFADEVQPHGAALRSYLLGRFPTLPDVDDVVQESLKRVLQAHEHGRVASPRGLLYAVARNLAIDAARRQQVVSFEPITEITDLSVTDDVDIVEAICKQQEFDLLTRAIQSLPDRCRQVMTLRVAYALSQKEIAAKLGISENTVEKQLGNGIRRCTEYFARLGLP
jgi:RNA polymerase sigma-70 factor (ECF subfamily)